jgi:predicted transglutaminase-like cysteine proteinase
MDQCVTSPGKPAMVVLSKDIETLLEQVNRKVNDDIWPEKDKLHYGRAEYWDIPADGYGNSKAYALTKRSELIKAGLSERALRIAIANAPSESRHVVLTVVTDHGDLVLDNFYDDVKLWTKLDYDWLERQDGAGEFGWVMLGGHQAE